MVNSVSAAAAAARVVRKTGSRNAGTIAKELNIHVVPCAFSQQKGVYTVIERNRYIFLKDDLDPVMREIVLCHEIGHDQLHRKEAAQAGMLQEFNLFDMQNRVMEYEANVFAAEIMLPDDEILEYIYRGMDIAQIAQVMSSDINLVALKAAELNRRGYRFRPQESKADFLR